MQKFVTPNAPGFTPRSESRVIYACEARRRLSEYIIHTPESFLKFDPAPGGVAGSEGHRQFRMNIYLLLFCKLK